MNPTVYTNALCSIEKEIQNITKKETMATADVNVLKELLGMAKCCTDILISIPKAERSVTYGGHEIDAMMVASMENLYSYAKTPLDRHRLDQAIRMIEEK